MSSRFQRLELEGQQPAADVPAGRKPPAQSAPLTAAESSEVHDAAYWLHKADHLRRKGVFEEALRDYSRAVELDRSLVPGWVGQVRMLIALEEFPEAELWARKALELFRNQVDLNAGRAQSLCRSGELKQALAACDASLQQASQSYYPWLVRGDIMLARKDPVEEHCFDKAPQLCGDWLVQIEIAEIYSYYHLHAKAMRRCQQAIAKVTDQPYCWYLQGRCAMAMGLDDLGRSSFKHCLDLDPKNAMARAAMKEAPARGGWLRRIFGRGA